MSELHRKILTLVAEAAGKPVDEIKLDHELVNDLGLDSLGVVELVMKAEDEFKIVIPDDDAQKLKKVGQVIEYIDATLSQPA
jgi:acyl carrier protein